MYFVPRQSEKKTSNFHHIYDICILSYMHIYDIYLHDEYSFFYNYYNLYYVLKQMEMKRKKKLILKNQK